MKRLSIRDLLEIALFTALTAVGAFVKIPIPAVPITLQFLFCALSGILLGARRSMLSQALYVALGLCGLPIFAAGGGFAYALRPSFGYLLGLIPASGLAGLVVEKWGKCTFVSSLLGSFVALFVVYLCGVPYLYGVYALVLGEAKTVSWALQAGLISVLPGDLLKVSLTALVAPRIASALRAIRKPHRPNNGGQGKSAAN